jgi:hypothetical protein
MIAVVVKYIMAIDVQAQRNIENPIKEQNVMTSSERINLI